MLSPMSIIVFSIHINDICDDISSEICQCFKLYTILVIKVLWLRLKALGSYNFV